MNAVEYLVSKGFKITSDPNKYASGVWGLRRYTENGIHYDYFCDGYHRAYDFASYHLAPVPSVFDGEVVSGTSAYGNFGGTVVIANKKLGLQAIYGHLDRNLPVKIGQKVKQGQTIGKQSFTNYDNVFMASHLHFQLQNYGYLASEKAFVCNGINPLKVDIKTGKQTSSKVSSNVLTYDDAWLWKGKLKTTADINYRIYPHTKAKKEAVIKKGTTIEFDKLYKSDKHWWVRAKYKGGIWFVAVGVLKGNDKFLNALDGKKLWVSPVGKVNTSGGKEKGSKRSYTIADSYEGNVAPAVVEKTFNMWVNRPRSLTAYVRGHIDGLGAEVRKRNGNNFNTRAGYELYPGDLVYIFEVYGGWGRIYTGNATGHGSNDWIWLERFIPSYIYK